MIHYILQILVVQLLFLLIYDLFLKKETFFNWNRVYLLMTSLLSFILPLIKIDVIKENIPEQYMIQLPAVLIGNVSEEIEGSEVIIKSSDSFFNFLTIARFSEYLWYTGMVISLFLFCYKLYRILKLKQTGIKTRVENFNLISLPNTNTAFSFFNTIFLGEKLSEVKKTNILLHEKIHIKEYHTLDLLFFEILRIICWFNPLVYVYQNRIAVLQEYIADSKAISETDKKEYYQDLLSQIFQTDKISFINTFFNHSLIKNRIVMLQKSKSKKIFQLKYLLLVPVMLLMLLYTSCAQDTSAQSKVMSENVDSPLIEKIQAVRHQIEKQGNVSPEEEKALKVLALLVTDDGFSNPHYEDVYGMADIPFGVIEKVPVFPGCENLSQEEKKKCFSQKISQYIVKQFNTKLAKENGLTGYQEIGARFSIGNDGKVKDIKVKNKSKILREEALRVLEGLPVMIPGEQEGKKVSVMYKLPIKLKFK